MESDDLGWFRDAAKAVVDKARDSIG